MRRLLYSLLCLVVLGGSVAAGETHVRDFGAVGDGVADDTAAIRRAVAEGGGVLVFSRGDYRITETIEINLGERGHTSVTGAGGVGRIVMDGPGSALRFVGGHTGTANPASFDEAVSANERMPRVADLRIVGKHPESDGLAFDGCMQITVHGVKLRDLRHGIHLYNRNRNLIVDAVHIYNLTGAGVFFDAVNLHQANIQGSHISYCKRGGIRVEGGEIRNLQITGNDIEYNYDQDAEESADVLLDTRGGTIREGTIASNTIQAVPSPNGANVRLRAPERPNGQGPVGMWTIAGNLIGNQEVNIHLENALGVTVTGNHIYTATERNVVVEGSRHVVLSGNSLDQGHNYGRDFTNGIRVYDSDGVILQGNVLNHVKAGSAEEGGAIEIVRARETLVNACQVFEAVHRGIHVRDSRNTMIQDCQVMDRTGESGMLAAIEVTGDSPGTVIRGNQYGAGRQGGIVAPEGATVGDNTLAAGFAN